MEIIKLYKKLVLPWRRRAEKAEALCKIQSNMIQRMSHKIMDVPLEKR